MRKSSITQKIISLMFNMGRVLNKQYLEENKRKNRLSALQLETLRFIRENREVLMKDLAGHLFITPPSATSLINDLIKAKLVGRMAHKQDRRIIGISLTLMGKQVLISSLKKKMENAGKIIDKLSSREKQALLKILEKLSKEKK